MSRVLPARVIKEELAKNNNNDTLYTHNMVHQTNNPNFNIMATGICIALPARKFSKIDGSSRIHFNKKRTKEWYADNSSPDDSSRTIHPRTIDPRTIHPGPFILDHSSWTIHPGPFILDDSSWTIHPWTIHPGPFIPDHSSWTIHPGPFILDHSSWTIHPGPFNQMK